VEPDAAVESQEPEEKVSSLRIVATLAVAGMLAGLLLVLVYKATEPAILRNKAEALRLAIQDVLGAPQRYDTLYVVDGKLTLTLPEGMSERGTEKVFLGFDEAGAPIGFALVAGEPGFQDIVRIIFGYDAGARTTLGIKVLESKETPGLGDKIEKDLEWVAQFSGAVTPLIPVKPGRGTGENSSEIDTITGATISSKAVIRIINNSLEKARPLLEAYTPEETP